MDWGKWFDLIPAVRSAFPKNYRHAGVYRVRIVSNDKDQISIGRIGGTDDQAIIYIGRNSNNLEKRLGEFLRGEHKEHPGGALYRKTKPILDRLDPFQGHLLQASVIKLPSDEIDRAEKQALRDYFNTFGELPPYSRSFPGNKE